MRLLAAAAAEVYVCVCLSVACGTLKCLNEVGGINFPASLCQGHLFVCSPYLRLADCGIQRCAQLLIYELIFLAAPL